MPTRLQPGLTDEDSSPATDQPFNDHDSHFDTDTPAQAPKRFEADRREAYLAQTRRWLAAQEYAKLDAFFPLYLRQYPQDIEFLLPRGRIYRSYTFTQRCHHSLPQHAQFYP
ncbi:hypothetical protein P4S73_05930 [Paraglaciecola sp. Hal342]